MILAILNLHEAPISPTVWALSDLGFGSRCGIKIHLGYPNGKISISMSLRSFPSSFSSIQLTVWEEMSFEEVQDGCHGGCLGYQNGTILAILNLYVAPMPPIKFWLNLSYGLGGDVICRMAAILVIGTERF